MNRISEAVILMAGTGSRLRHNNGIIPKPLTPILDRPLISYTVDLLARAGITILNAVVGYESATLIPVLERLVPPGMRLRLIDNPNWQKQNGLSVLAAANHMAKPFLLTMADHLFDEAIVDLLIERAELNELNLAIDRKIESIYDIDDAMKVQMRSDYVAAIGKDLAQYDAIDTGVFVCPLALFDYLERAKKNGDCGLADGVRLMAADGKVRGIDIGDGWWQDVDTPEMLRQAEEQLRKLSRPSDRAWSQAASPRDVAALKW
ncbi:MAG: NTP transferase domain-containing protein [Chthoniobacterales bacterium]